MYIFDTTPTELDELLHWFSDAFHKICVCLTALFAATGTSMQQSVLAPSAGTQALPGQYLLGLGIADITGPVVETNMMGYAYLPQTDTGLHMRQRARAWVIADQSSPSDRFVYINADIAMGDTGIRRSVVKQLSEMYPGLYNNENIALGSTHQHSGVGGYLENLLPQITSKGYVKETADAIVTGTVLAVKRAHESLQPGQLALGNTTVLGANINRSPSAYLANPAEERARYKYDQDKELTLLRFDDTNGNPRGFLSFFPVHGTSLYENNTLVSGDNKGMAAYLYEAMMEPHAMPGNNTFVAGFTQANVGDTSPNTEGAFCESPGQPWDGMPCQFDHSTCGNKTEDCHGRGPGFRISDFESNKIIAQRQVDGAKKLMSRNLRPVSGSVAYVHTYLDMRYHSFQLPNGTTVQTCPPAMGYSFAGGTTDGPGAFDFIQGDNSSDPQNPFWQIVKGAITPYPLTEQITCQFPKPILLNTGYAELPYPWSPHTVDIQLLRAGNLVIAVIPGELTTMSGRRLREAVRDRLISSGILGNDAYVVIAGPANTYGHYVATKEEYAMQRYEGASTIFGQYTLDAYIDKYTDLVRFLDPDVVGTPESDDAPKDLTGEGITFRIGVVVDHAPLGKQFGDVLTDVLTNVPYHAGDTVSARFVGANPRNNFRLEETFLTVDQLMNGQWAPVRSDSHPSTLYQWLRTSSIFGESAVNISWTIEDMTASGTYRLTYFGDSKSLGGSITPFIGHSSSFTVS